MPTDLQPSEKVARVASLYPPHQSSDQLLVSSPVPVSAGQISPATEQLLNLSSPHFYMCVLHTVKHSREIQLRCG